jgi:hypothetical protein
MLFDDLITSYIILLRDYSELHLPNLKRSSSIVIYQCVNLLLPLIEKRIKQNITIGSVNNNANNTGNNNQSLEEISFRNNTVLLILQLLNHLTTKDLLLDDEVVDTNSQIYTILNISPNISLEVLIGNVVLNGLMFFIPMMTADLLRSFPLTCERYFSFICYFMNIYEQIFAEYICTLSIEFAIDVMSKLFEHLLWSAGAIDTISARMALNVSTKNGL